MVKKKPKPMSKTGWIVGGAVVLGLVACGWAFVGNGEEAAAGPSLPRALTVEGIKEAGVGPGAARGTLRQAMEDETLTNEQRRQARRNMRSVWRERMKERVDEYFAAAEAAREAMLDKHIDEFEKRMKEWQKQRDADNRSDEERQSRREQMRQARQNRSQEERKADSESRDPDDTARTMAYFSALRDRMNARGMQMPGRFGGGGRGGPGGGRGGSGGGRSGRR